jgi:DNA repair protein RadC
MNTMQEKNTLKQWAIDDQPREKLLAKGKSSLSNSELLAILLKSGSKNETAVELAKKILDSCHNNLLELNKLGIEKLKKFKGVGLVKAITIEAALELGKRRQLSEAKEQIKILSSNDAYQYLKISLEDLNHEEAWAIFLDSGSKIISMECISKGGMHATLMDSKIIFKRGLELSARSIIISHNHPSGELTPSKQDLDITKNLVEAGKVIGINIVDHLIIGKTNYYSFSDHNNIISVSG